MGEEIHRSQFTQADFDQFRRNLAAETELLGQWFDDTILDSDKRLVGLELEAWLVDQDYRPAPINEKFLSHLNNSLVVPELSQYNVEINTTPHTLTGNSLSQLRNELQGTWQSCHQTATAMNSDLLMIGILPTLQTGMLTIKQMSEMQRFLALNEQIFQMRRGQSMNLDIQGEDHLMMSCNDVMMEAATTSIQIHLQVNPDLAVRTYNASLIVSAITVAVAANSPFLFGKSLWDETRIPLFEQAVAVGSMRGIPPEDLRRVTFGSSYMKDSLYECFVENLVSYPILLPAIFQQRPAEMNHLRLHNGTIWRWNRPLIGHGDDGRFHLRLEHRVMAAGPTVIDIVANMALYLGLTHQLAIQPTPPESRLLYTDAKQNFYHAAKDSLNARVRWLNGQSGTIQALLLDKLLPEAARGLRALGCDQDEIDLYLNGVIRERVRTQQHGASWQRRYVEEHGPDWTGLTAAYAERQEEGQPVHTWSC